MVAKTQSKNNCRCGHRSMGYTPSEFDREAIRKGTIVEFEHTCDPTVARRISTDHISELGPLYYEELEKLETKLSKLHQEVPDKRRTRCPSPVVKEHKTVVNPTPQVRNTRKKSNVNALTTVQVIKPKQTFDDLIK